MARCVESIPVLLLTPSRDLGGGIERYVKGVQTAVTDLGGVVYRRDYLRPGQKASLGQQLQFLRATAGAMGRLAPTFRTMVMHPSLLPLAYPLARVYGSADCAVFYYGADIWAVGPAARWITTHAPKVRVITISRFGRDALKPMAQASILPPGLSESWFRKLVESDSGRQEDRDIDVLSVFRLADWKTKGADILLQGISQASSVNRPLRVVLAGQGPAPAELAKSAEQVAGVSVIPSPSDSSLAHLYGRSRLVALATRAQTDGHPSVEGFGMVLQEAQIAGAPVVAPSGGATDAYLEGTTGLRLADESPEALAAVITSMLANEDRRAAMAARGSSWARETFSPLRYRELVGEVILRR